MKKKIDITQTLRHLVQLAVFLLFPGLFLSIFNALKDIVTAIVSGTFSFTGLAGQFVLLLIVFGLTALWGRFFCGYLCSFGAIQELVSWLSHKLMPRLRSVPSRIDRGLKYAKYVLFRLIVLFVWVLQLPVDSDLSPWGVFGMLVSGNLSVMSAAVPTVGFAVLLTVLVGSFFAERFFCRYLCPLGALFTITSSRRLFRIGHSRKACTNCGLCSRKCAMGIYVHKTNKVASGECINCMRCVSVCQFDALHTSPHPAVAGTAAALMMYGMVYAGNALTNGASNAESYSPVVALGEMQGRYADGVYTGTGNGFRGEVQVQVTIEKGNITDISVLSFRDDSQYFNKARTGVISAIIQQQTPEVSTVSGATFSSEGIMQAVANALESTGYISQNITDGANAISSNGTHGETAEISRGNRSGKSSSFTVPETNGSNNSDEEMIQSEDNHDTASQSGNYADSVYTGTGKGLRGNTQVQVTVSGGKISDITVISYADDRQYFSRAQGSMIDRIMENQGINVSTVSGATYSSNSILEAVADALDIEFTNPNSSMGSGQRGGKRH